MLQQARFPRAAAARPLSFLSFLLCENEPAGQLGRHVWLVTREDRLATEVRGQASEKFSSLGLLLRARTGPPEPCHRVTKGSSQSVDGSNQTIATGGDGQPGEP